MDYFNQRRAIMGATLFSPLLSACSSFKPTVSASNLHPAIIDQLAAIEKSINCRLGIAALDTGNGRRIAYRAEERFPMCSTVKMLIAAAILEKNIQDPTLLQRRIHYKRADLVVYSPITEPQLESGMTVAELCKATVQYSDNSAANFLLNVLGGPSAVTTFARSLGDTITRLDRMEPELNTAIPGDERDTTSPVAMMNNLRRLLIPSAQFSSPLPPAQASILQAWLVGNTTGEKRIRSGVPKEWQVGDKTGGGAYGTTNDIAIICISFDIIWPPGRAPILFSMYLTETKHSAEEIIDV